MFLLFKYPQVASSGIAPHSCYVECRFCYHCFKEWKSMNNMDQKKELMQSRASKPLGKAANQGSVSHGRQSWFNRMGTYIITALWEWTCNNGPAWRIQGFYALAYYNWDGISSTSLDRSFCFFARAKCFTNLSLEPFQPLTLQTALMVSQKPSFSSPSLRLVERTSYVALTHLWTPRLMVFVIVLLSA